MSFGLKNAGATYQRLINLMFQELIGETVEVYVDDIIVKRKKREERLVQVAVAVALIIAIHG